MNHLILIVSVLILIELIWSPRIQWAQDHDSDWLEKDQLWLFYNHRKKNGMIKRKGLHIW